MAKKESQIQKGVINWLLYHKCFVWRNNTGSYETAAGHYVSYGFKGSPDIVGMLPNGRFLGVEVKTVIGKQNKDQKIFEQRVKECGGIYIIARSIDDLEREIRPLL